MIEWLLTTAMGLGITSVATLCLIFLLVATYALGMKGCSRAWMALTGISQNELERGAFRDELAKFREAIDRLRKAALRPAKRAAGSHGTDT